MSDDIERAEAAHVAAIVEAIAEYDSEEARRAHVAMRMAEFWDKEAADAGRGEDGG